MSNHPRNVGATDRIARYTCRRAVVLDGWEWWKGGNGFVRTGLGTGVIEWIWTSVIGPGDQTGRPYIIYYWTSLRDSSTNDRTRLPQITE